MSTKQQELEALKKICEIVAELGPDSYIATAFEGCFEVARSNIENDFADSMKARWQDADRKLNEANGTIEELRAKLAESEKDYEAAHATAQQIAEEKDAEIAFIKNELINAGKLADCIKEYQQRIEKAEGEIICLKAKLYDYLIKTETI